MNDERFVWNAPAYDHHEHGADWYWAVSIITLSLAIAFFIAHNILLSIIIIIGMGTLLMHAKHAPEILDYELSRKGVHAGKTFYLWESLESFWILEEIKTEKEFSSAKLLLTSRKSFMPHIVVPLGDVSIEDIRHVLASMLSEEPQIEPLPERVMRKLGF